MRMQFRYDYLSLSFRVATLLVSKKRGLVIGTVYQIITWYIVILPDIFLTLNMRKIELEAETTQKAVTSIKGYERNGKPPCR